MNPTQSVNIAYIYEKIYELFSGAFLPSPDSMNAFFSTFLLFWKPVAVLLSLLFITGVIYCNIRIRAIVHEAEEEAHAHHAGAHGEGGHGESLGGSHASTSLAAGGTQNKRWEKIEEHINSENPSDWRLAILECDIILDEMLTKMSYHGETIADKLKAVEKSDFLSIDKAWEAHRVRNAIAHGGSNFEISDREARRVVSLYEDVFKEFHFI